MQAYSREYLFDAMTTLGEAFECIEQRTDYTFENFLDLFIATGVAEEFGRGNPKFVTGMSGVELVLEVYYRAGEDLGVPVFDLAPGDVSAPGCAYWCGWILAFYQWQSGRTFKNIRAALPMDALVALYPTMHEASEERACDAIDEALRPMPSPLATVRKARGVSQEALAEASGVSLRAIQQYEQRYKDINKAQVASVYRLSVALGCSIEDLLEFPLR